MYYKINDFISDRKSEAVATIKLLETLTDESLKQKVYSEGRTLGYIAWHIVLTLGEMALKTGIKVDCPNEDSPSPLTANEILSAYKTASNSLIDIIEKQWTDGTLDTEDNMYGEMWKKGMSLDILNKHEIHHRGQLSVLMRQAGLIVPGVCGPSKEEWLKFNIPPMK